MSLQGKCALVTGGGRGLGRSYALHLASLGADVAVLDVDTRSYRDFEREAAAMTAESTALEVQALGRRAIEIEADVGDAAAVQAAADRIESEWGQLDIVVCNAGGGLGTPAASKASTMDLDQFEAVLRRNLYGTVYTCTAAAPMIGPGGSVSVGGYRMNGRVCAPPRPPWKQISSSKAQPSSSSGS